MPRSVKLYSIWNGDILCIVTKIGYKILFIYDPVPVQVTPNSTPHWPPDFILQIM